MPTLTTRALAALIVSAALSTRAASEPVAPMLLRGTVHTVDGAPVVGANVFLVETRDGALSDSAGRFTVRTTHLGAATLFVRRIGYNALQRPLDLPMAADAPLDLALDAQAALSTLTRSAAARAVVWIPLVLACDSSQCDELCSSAGTVGPRRSCNASAQQGGVA
jgi:hypothetical protein